MREFIANLLWLTGIPSNYSTGICGTETRGYVLDHNGYFKYPLNHHGRSWSHFVSYHWRWTILNYIVCLEREFFSDWGYWKHAWKTRKTSKSSQEKIARLWTKNFWLYEVRWVCPDCKVSWCAYLRNGDLTCACLDPTEVKK
jgi:hypothetical protein